MVKFKNILTKHVFILPEDKAIEIIRQAPDVYEIISGLDKHFITTHIKPEVELSELKDIYSIVVEEEYEPESDFPQAVEKKVRKSITKKMAERKTAVTRKKEKLK